MTPDRVFGLTIAELEHAIAYHNLHHPHSPATSEPRLMDDIATKSAWQLAYDEGYAKGYADGQAKTFTATLDYLGPVTFGPGCQPFDHPLSCICPVAITSASRSAADGPLPTGFDAQRQSEALDEHPGTSSSGR